MTQTAKIILALGLGIIIGAAAIPSLQAQPGRHGAYIVAETRVNDPAGFMEYIRREPATTSLCWRWRAVQSRRAAFSLNSRTA